MNNMNEEYLSIITISIEYYNYILKYAKIEVLKDYISFKYIYVKKLILDVCRM